MKKNNIIAAAAIALLATLASCSNDSGSEALHPGFDADEALHPSFHAVDTRGLAIDDNDRPTVYLHINQGTTDQPQWTDAYRYTLAADGTLTPAATAGGGEHGSATLALPVGTQTLDICAYATVPYDLSASLAPVSATRTAPGSGTLPLPVMHRNVASGGTAAVVTWSHGERPTIALRLVAQSALIRVTATDSQGQPIALGNGTDGTATLLMPGAKATAWKPVTGDSPVPPTLVADGNVSFTPAGAEAAHPSAVAQIVPTDIKKGDVLFTLQLGTGDSPVRTLTAPQDYTFLPGVAYDFHLAINTHGEITLQGFNIEGMAEGEQISNIIFIRTAADLKLFRDIVNGTTDEYDQNRALCAIQVANVVLTDEDQTSDDGKGWTPIGTHSNPDETSYTGTYLGGGYTISGLKINRPYGSYQGLFGYTDEGAKISGIGLVDATVTGDAYTGALVGWNYKGTITECHATGGTVTGYYYTGGLVGYNQSGTITACHATGGAVTGTYKNTGGLVGWNYKGTITDCHTTGDVTGTREYTGGLVGENTDGTITKCYATGTVKGNDECTGGLVGANYGTITECYATGEVTGKSQATGGLVGANSSSSTITACTATGNVSGTSNTGGLVGENNSTSTITACAATGTVKGKNERTGGLLGRNYYGTITACYAKGDVEGTGNYTGGLLGQNENGTIIACYATGSVTGTTYTGALLGDNTNGTITYSHAIVGTPNPDNLVGNGTYEPTCSTATGTAGITVRAWDGNVEGSTVSVTVGTTTYTGADIWQADANEPKFKWQVAQ